MSPPAANNALLLNSKFAGGFSDKCAAVSRFPLCMTVINLISAGKAGAFHHNLHPVHPVFN
ncbi:hypothetical protein EHS86_14085 [Erwinia amylovora]|uniref:Uncharacterized protein n=3 Tax=Erwinia amylovora TaxID=552 RepID=A0A830ZTG3_ERWAM|nr:hypothetical protein AD997_09905 [Erwinia amylovora]EKV54705.1 hypothetical protein EaACW_2009 [Erwinia amylovora ACW56400]CBA20947.1 hypothetical protein predicted by Glimmer/Critica [Erwinia amylovora CFBP1430]CBJ46625.1 hypothetical protein EAM_1950 [Erwinia amylovora ATCC 49946]CBX80871.1 hypothetical protein predicted by Glimmer/Critica [Erwinia amylovora ATCC BAA-2158]CCO78856.1 hypothetical protein BN432_2059 [Erwinia amylovora Ea356]CCO82653.1 hypothetical protein BN433_2083 [Erwin